MVFIWPHTNLITWHPNLDACVEAPKLEAVWRHVQKPVMSLPLHKRLSVRHTSVIIWCSPKGRKHALIDNLQAGMMACTRLEWRVKG